MMTMVKNLLDSNIQNTGGHTYELSVALKSHLFNQLNNILANVRAPGVKSILSSWLLMLIVVTNTSLATPFSVTRIPSSLTPIKMLPSGAVVAIGGNEADGASIHIFSKEDGNQLLGEGVIPMSGAVNLKVNSLGDGVFSTEAQLSKPFAAGTKKLVLRERDGTIKVIVAEDSTLSDASWAINDSKRVVALFVNGSETRLKAFDIQTQAYSVAVVVDAPTLYVLNDGRVLIKNYQSDSAAKPHLVISSSGITSNAPTLSFPADAKIVAIRSNSTVVFQSGSKLYSTDLVNPAQELAVALEDGDAVYSVSPSGQTVMLRENQLAYISGQTQIDSIPCSYPNSTRLNFTVSDIDEAIADDGSIVTTRTRVDSSVRGTAILTPRSLVNSKDYCPRVSVKVDRECGQVYKQIPPGDAGQGNLAASSKSPVSCSITVRAVSRSGQPLRRVKVDLFNLGKFTTDADGGSYRSSLKFVRSQKTNKDGFATLRVRLNPTSGDYQIRAPYQHDDYRSTEYDLVGRYDLRP